MEEQAISGSIPFRKSLQIYPVDSYHFYNFRNGMNPEIVISVIAIAGSPS